MWFWAKRALLNDFELLVSHQPDDPLFSTRNPFAGAGVFVDFVSVESGVAHEVLGDKATRDLLIVSQRDPDGRFYYAIERNRLQTYCRLTLT